MNKIILLGRLTKNPEIKYSQTNNILLLRLIENMLNKAKKDKQIL